MSPEGTDINESLKIRKRVFNALKYLASLSRWDIEVLTVDQIILVPLGYATLFLYPLFTGGFFWIGFFQLNTDSQRIPTSIRCNQYDMTWTSLFIHEYNGGLLCLSQL